ncbi:Formyltransferase [Gyrodon lividus]|nr:Formyltransferase [Gyrodon lividus]
MLVTHHSSRRRLIGVTSTNVSRNAGTPWSSSSTHTHKRTFLSSCTRHNSGADALFTSSSPSSQASVREPFTILFCGRDAFSCAVFKEVHKAKDVWNGLHIATNSDVKTGRNGSRLDISPLKTLGETFGVPVHTFPKEKSTFKHWLPPPPFTSQPSAGGSDSLISLPTSHLLITASFGRIIPTAILRLFPDTQRLNVHPSLLPAYRGPAPIQRALMAGERDTGVCVIEMGEVSRKAGKAVDAGGIWGVERVNIPENANFSQMQEDLAERGGKILVQVLRAMLLGQAQRKTQDHLTHTTPHAPVITTSDSAINFASQSAFIIARLERAIGHQRALTVPAGLPDGRTVTIADLRVVPCELRPTNHETSLEGESPGIAHYSPQTKSLFVMCADGTWLSVERLQTQDKAILMAKEWWNGVKSMGWVKNGRFRFSQGL